MCTYDRLIRMRRKPFPHVKCEQAVYYFYATAENSVLNMVKITEKILRLMDREDETAEEINTWQKNKGSIVLTELPSNLIFIFTISRCINLKK